jgi:hypothetical protein
MKTHVKTKIETRPPLRVARAGPARRGLKDCTVRARRTVLPGRRTLARHSPQSHGITIAELVMSLTITVLIGVSIAAVVYASASTVSGQQATRTLMVSNEVSSLRINAALRSSSTVLARGNYYLVLWLGDRNGSGAPSLSEIQRIDLDPNTKQLWSFKAPANLAPGNDTAYTVGSTDFNAVTTALKGSANFPSTLWATGITGWTTTPAAADPNKLSYVGYQISSLAGGVTLTTAGGGGLRNH